MFPPTFDFNELYLFDSEITTVGLGRDGWFGEQSGYWMNSPQGDEMPKLLARRLCGSVWILTPDGECEGVRLRQALPRDNFIYPQVRWRHELGEPIYTTPYERDANRPAPFWMVMEQVTPEFYQTVADYSDERDWGTPRLFKIDEEVFMLLKLKFS